MENMALQHNEVIAKKEEKKKTRKKYAIVSIAQGDGIIDIFKETGSDIVLNGGQTMNTSSAEMIDAFKEANADSIIVLPSNGNIIMAAKQAAELYKDSKVYVLETKSIPATYNALNMIIGGEESVEECYQSMLEANETLTTGFICKSIRNSDVDGVHSVKGDYIEGVNGHLVGDHKDRTEAVLDLLSKVEDIDQKSVLFGFYGQMMTKEEVEQ
jgi:dihydroxyacetone kinase-like predicted kinase